MSVEIKLSDQETKVINFLTSRNNGEVYWEELAQFAKEPTKVKLKTIKKTVSEIKRKYVQAGSDFPLKVTFKTLAPEKEEPNLSESSHTIMTVHDDGSLPVSPEIPKPQVLVQVKRTPTSTPVNDSVNQASTSVAAQVVKAQIQVQRDFEINRNWKRVNCRDGSYMLNDNEWEVFKYIHENAGKIIPISELRDKVVFPHYGSKLPARWFDSIMRIINNIRRQIPGINKRLLTVKGLETSYLFQ